MAVYIITYDTHRGRNYQSFYDGMAQARGVRLAESVWGLVSQTSAGAVRDWVRSLLDGDDTIVVVQVAMMGDWATSHASKTANDWLKFNVHF